VGYHCHREERDPIVRKAIPYVRCGNNYRSAREARGSGDGSEVVSRESPVVIVVIKWRLADGFASVVCIRRSVEGNTG